MEGLQQLYYLYGIGYDFTKYNGEYVVFDETTRNAALNCCGIDTSDQAHVYETNFSLDVAPWMRMLEEVTLASSALGVFELKVPESHRCEVVNIAIAKCQLALEVDLASCPEVGNYQHNNERYVALEISIGELPVGYFDMRVSCSLGTFKTELWSVPNRCYNPYSEQRENKSIGLSLQLYTLKSDRNYGIGDFGDLKELVSKSASVGVDFILLNPLHMLFSEQPEKASPYSPSHRCLINPLYIALDDVQNIVGNACWSRFLATSDLSKNRIFDGQYVDYSKVSETKYRLYEQLYDAWVIESDSCSRYQAFLTTQTIAHENLPLSSFEWFLQWICATQLERNQVLAKQLGMQIGLVNDLAVGCTKEGLEYQTYRDCFTNDANVGAPPDPWAENGQNWGLPAPNPQKLKSGKYHYFKSLVRANMHSVGALRIDHVMALRRLWWCFTEGEQALGCYVYYPFEHLLAILKIESHLNETIVIGEDLGVVPPEVTTALEESAIFGNTLFYFEKNNDGSFKHSDAFRVNALTMVANHDVPPFYGWWNGKDIDVKLSYNIIDQAQRQQQRSERDTEKSRLLDWLSMHNDHCYSLDSPSDAIYCAVMKVIAGCPSQLIAVQLDDLDMQQIPVNIPGTDTEYPNWRRKLNHELADIFRMQQDFIKQLSEIRKEQ
ncbi:4-alpha-glucanotransferase [Pseudoalteromonas sp. SMS1]|uniref:4-alpha-glucanotransferase n=1 Tax=Pseudoalteromonas sp. SMS1 TaxID=2908894 RepID=UPI001F40482F|nr:4-alpha-glucanotransferase [Pseudoalteromonas sp. SMS1]MCF2856028.1 4-alpha-glucanotransferase [Pseudoalteromonas sp. SMS1]